MAKLAELIVPIDDVLDLIYSTKLERGGYLEIIIPAIGMAGKVHYQGGADSLIDTVEVAKNGEAVIPKYIGRKVLFNANFSDYKDTYNREHIVYSAFTKKNPEPKQHKLTFYWRLVKKAKAEKK